MASLTCHVVVGAKRVRLERIVRHAPASLNEPARSNSSAARAVAGAAQDICRNKYLVLIGNFSFIEAPSAAGKEPDSLCQHATPHRGPVFNRVASAATHVVGQVISLPHIPARRTFPTPRVIYPPGSRIAFSRGHTNHRNARAQTPTFAANAANTNTAAALSKTEAGNASDQPSTTVPGYRIASATGARGFPWWARPVTRTTRPAPMVSIRPAAILAHVLVLEITFDPFSVLMTPSPALCGPDLPGGCSGRAECGGLATPRITRCRESGLTIIRHQLVGGGQLVDDILLLAAVTALDRAICARGGVMHQPSKSFCQHAGRTAH